MNLTKKKGYKVLRKYFQDGMPAFNETGAGRARSFRDLMLHYSSECKKSSEPMLARYLQQLNEDGIIRALYCVNNDMIVFFNPQFKSMASDLYTKKGYERNLVANKKGQDGYSFNDICDLAKET